MEALAIPAMLGAGGEAVGAGMALGKFLSAMGDPDKLLALQNAGGPASLSEAFGGLRSSIGGLGQVAKQFQPPSLMGNVPPQPAQAQPTQPSLPPMQQPRPVQQPGAAIAPIPPSTDNWQNLLKQLPPSTDNWQNLLRQLMGL